MKKTAIILGATGLTGGLLLNQLIKDSNYDKIKLFSRSSVGIDSPKIEEYLIDMFELESHSKDFTGDVVFCCIGTTKAKTPDKTVYHKIDYGIPVAAAKLAKQNGIETYMVISALGANPKSAVFYNKTKGEMERDVLAEGIKKIYILQPSLIVGDRNENRTSEGMATVFMKTFDFLIPKRYKAIQAETIAEAMRVLAEKGYPEKRIPSDEIKSLCKK